MEKSNLQLSFFDNSESIKFSQREQQNRFANYCLDDYIFDINHIGLEKTWEYICDYVIENGENKDFLKVDNFGEMYEVALALIDKNLKKNSGQYYTPDDISLVMGKWFNNTEGYNICDVGCGTGKLILTYLNIVGYDKAIEIISSGRLYLYDIDEIALKICKTSIMVKYGIEYEKDIHEICCDFLDENITLPVNSKVISNPPYASISEFKENWILTDVLKDSKEFYSSFMEKIINQSLSSVIITPFSFISGNKFSSLRKFMSEYGNGFVVSFDNVPGNIFCGRKHGVFNTNTANSVRAAITVMHKSDKKGFRISPLIRFKNVERAELLSPKVLESLLPDRYQVIDFNNTVFEKIDKNLIDVFDKWKSCSDFVIKDLITDGFGEYTLDIPNTCRYYTTASYRKLNRSGSITLHLKDENVFNFLYCFINSSFAYWWWRVYDGAITYPVGLFNKLPVPYNLLTDEDKIFFSNVCKEMMDKELKYVIKKMNAGVEQENIKFPEEYRKKINKKILEMLGCENSVDIFETLHSNKIFINSF